MSVITQPSRFAGVSLVEVVDATTTGVSLNVRKRDGESILTVFLGWSELIRVLEESQRRVRRRST